MRRGVSCCERSKVWGCCFRRVREGSLRCGVRGIWRKLGDELDNIGTKRVSGGGDSRKVGIFWV